MFITFGMEESRRDDYDTDSGLEHSEEDIYQQFMEFYEDVLPEFKSIGKVVQFKVSSFPLSQYIKLIAVWTIWFMLLLVLHGTVPTTYFNITYQHITLFLSPIYIYPAFLESATPICSSSCHTVYVKFCARIISD